VRRSFAPLLLCGLLAAVLVPGRGEGAVAQGTYTATATHACSGTGDFADAEDFCEACSSDGTWDLSVSPTPGAGSVAGDWNLYFTNTDYCPDDDPDPSPRAPFAASPFGVMQGGASLSASFLGAQADRLGDFLGTPCTASCPAPGSCSVDCPDVSLTCDVTCTPATDQCRDPFVLAGSYSNGSVHVTMSWATTSEFDCPGHGTLTIVDGATAVLDGPEPTPAWAAWLAIGALVATRQCARRRP